MKTETIRLILHELRSHNKCSVCIPYFHDIMPNKMFLNNQFWSDNSCLCNVCTYMYLILVCPIVKLSVVITYITIYYLL